MPAPRFWAVVPAAGIGRRMGAATPKQYLELAGRALIAHAVGCLAGHPQIAAVVVALAAGDRWWPRVREAEGLAAIETTGGATRADSVLAGLAALAGHADPEDWVLVHDAARPCLRGDDLERLIAAGAGHPDGALLAIPVRDTVKRADPAGRVVATVERSGLWRAQTPQMFRLGALREALAAALAAGHTVTDEAQAMERAGAAPLLVEGCAENIKVTTPADLALAELYLRARGVGEEGSE